MSSRIENWVNQGDSRYKLQRQAIRTILLALCKSSDLKDQVFLKGGILLGIAYESTRYTTDIDISNQSLFNESGFDENSFNKKLSLASNELKYGLHLRTQSVKINPKRTKGKFRSYQIKIGYAKSSSANEFAKLKKGKASNVIKIDYSFNEDVDDKSELNIFENVEIKTYGIHTLIAEKYRALLQQVKRNRNRRQDVYDLHFLISNGHVSAINKTRLKKTLIDKCIKREIVACKESLDDPEIRSRAETDFDSLADETEGELVEFEKAFNLINEYYHSIFE